MKKTIKLLLSTIVLSLVLYSVNAADWITECQTFTFCGHSAVVCDSYDYVIWDEIYCPPND